MDCSTIKQKIHDYIDGSLPPDEKKRIEAHLAGCETCRVYASDLKKTIETLKGLDAMPAPPWLTQKVMQKVREESRPKKGLLQKLFFPLHIKLPIEAVATLLIAGAAILIIKSMGPDLRTLPSPREEHLIQPTPSSQEQLSKDHLADSRGQQKAEQVPPPAKQSAAESLSGQPRPADQQPAPALPASAAPATPRSMEKSVGDGKAVDERDGKEERLNAVSGSAGPAVSAENKASNLPTFTLIVSDIEKGSKEIEIALSKLGGKLLAIERHETRASMTMHIEPSQIDELMAQLRHIGSIKGPEPDIAKLDSNNITILLILQ